jgi:hypothetical protein
VAKIICDAVNEPSSDQLFYCLTQELAMNTIHANIIRDIRPSAVVAIVALLALSLAVIITLAAQIDAPGGGIFAGIGAYITKVGEALASG